MRRKGFTLLELIIVIIIIGVLATLGVANYRPMMERARSAEARIVIGAMRSMIAALREGIAERAVTGADAGIGPGGNPGPTKADCVPTHFFWYNVTGKTNTPVFTATRCANGAGGKTPEIDEKATPGKVMLTTNFPAGTDVWTSTAPY